MSNSKKNLFAVEGTFLKLEKWYYISTRPTSFNYHICFDSAILFYLHKFKKKKRNFFQEILANRKYANVKQKCIIRVWVFILDIYRNIWILIPLNEGI